MKRNMLYLGLLTLVAGAAPLFCLLLPGPDDAKTPSATVPPGTVLQAATPETAPSPAATASQAIALQPLTLYDSAAGRERVVSVRDFLVGAAACEMPPDWPDDALLAQMVASHSYALSLGQPMTVNSAQCAGWTTAEVLQARWGQEFDACYSRLCALAEQVQAELLLYNGTPAAACYHAISSGRTEASQNVWVAALPYLQGVDSPWDRTADGFEVTVTYTQEQFADAVESLTGEAPDGEPSGWLGEAVRDEAGHVLRLTLAGQTVTGTSLRGALGLRSTNFSMAWRGGAFVVTTRGYGHCVGLSQYGARAMAAGGADWKEILLYYFPGTEITENRVQAHNT